jgi:hypothetical protein
MNHQQIQNQDIIERFVRHQLPADERRAFQEHYFACDECFERVQTTAQFIGAVRDAAKRGVLSEQATAAEPWWKAWFKPALILAAATAAVLAVALGYVFFRQNPAPREDVARENRPAPKQTENGRPTPTPVDVAINHPPRTPEPTNPAQAKAPIVLPTVFPTVLLDSARDARSGGNQLNLPANAASARLLVEVEPGRRFDSFQLILFDAEKRPVTRFSGMKANSQGVLAVNVPAALLPNGKFLVKLYGAKGGERTPVGEYDLTVRRQ